MKKLSLLFVLVIINSVHVFSQQSHRAYRELADSLYKFHNYKDAAFYYERAVKNAADSASIMLRIAKSYSEINSLKESEVWYNKAIAQHASLTADDTYNFVKDLLKFERRQDAETVLREFLAKTPDDDYAKSLLWDILHVKMYFADSSAYTIAPLSVINTPASEFSPVYYDDGLVFTTARPQSSTKKRYHLDKSYFLSLYYADRGTNGQLQNPVPFGKEISSDFHNGPASFYRKDQRMILNRNLENKMRGSEDIYMSHLALFDAVRDIQKKTWSVMPLPFADSAYSFAHPHISEDGNTLYFSSDKPGGYGGMDLYASFRRSGQWTVPHNLGPLINTPENEVFPFYFDNTLYFASDGHGGLGGLDLFKSNFTPNGFSVPVNLGYPLNSHLDDFALITRDHRDGYFSTSRSGNDDLYEFHTKPKVTNLLARVHDGITSASVPGAEVEIITDVRDFILVSGNGGNLRFELPEESAYLLIARKNGKTGMLAGVAESSEDNEHTIHEIALFGDSLSVACVGVVRDETGFAQKVEEVHVFDESTGEPIASTFTLSMVYFPGKRDHRYRVVVKSAHGTIVEKTIEVTQEDHGTKTWSMEAKSQALTLILNVKVMDENSKTAIPNANVIVSTFNDPDQVLTSNETGDVQTSLPRNAAYLIVASNDHGSGMQSGFAEAGYDQNATLDTVFIKSGFNAPVHGIVLITNSQGETLKDARVTIINHTTGDTTSQQVENGVLNFSSQPRQTYTIRVERKGYATVEKKVVTSDVATEKVSIIMHEDEPVDHTIAARVFQGTDNTPVAGAEINVLKFSDKNLTLTSNDEGVAEFTVPDGDGYIITAKKNSQSGVYVGVAEKGTDKSSVIHPVTLTTTRPDSIRIFGIVTNQEGTVLRTIVAEVTDTLTAEKIPVTVENGILSFPTKPGGRYKVSVSAENYSTEQRIIVADSSSSLGGLSSIQLRKHIPVTVTIGDSNGVMINDATVVVKDAVTGQEIASEMKDGVLTIASEQGKSYSITVTHNDYGTASEEIIVPRLAESVIPRYIALPSKDRSSFNILARVLMASDNLPVKEASVRVISFVADELTMTSDKDGLVEFKLAAGSSYIIVAKKGEYSGIYSGVSEKDSVQQPVIHPVVIQTSPRNRVMVLTMVSDENGVPLAAADVIVTDLSTGEKVTAKLENGFLAFNGKKGVDYTIEIKAQGYETATEKLSIKASAKEVDPLRVTLHALKKINLLESLRVVLASDSSVVPNTPVKLISFDSDDLNLITNEQGLVEFSLTAGAAYMAVANKGDYFGVYSGVLPELQSTAVHTLVVNDKDQNRIPVLGLLADGDGRPVLSAKVIVTDNQTGERIEAQVNHGTLVFFGKKGGDYKIEVASDEYETQIENIKISQDATTPQEIEITFKSRKLLVLPEASSLVIVNNESPRVYITGVDSRDEIIEEDGMLYLQNGEGKRLLGKGQLKALLENPMRMIEMSENQLLKLDNIYFDFNTAFLDESDRMALDVAKKMMLHYPLLQLTVNTHADTRGSDHYNLQLTRRRAKAVKHYLVKQGVKARRIEARAYGKSTPAVICATPECSEEQHQKNRRAEFELPTSPKNVSQPSTITKSKPIVMKPSAKARVSSSYAALLAKYGDRQKEGLVFKVCVGAYRLNPNLTFSELNDLGVVERQETNGIHSYYLQSFQSLQTAEDIRQKVILRGINDAYIAIFYNGKRISFSRFVSITE